jgi:hypothetical protein
LAFTFSFKKTTSFFISFFTEKRKLSENGSTGYNFENCIHEIAKIRPKNSVEGRNNSGVLSQQKRNLGIHILLEEKLSFSLGIIFAEEKTYITLKFLLNYILMKNIFFQAKKNLGIHILTERLHFTKSSLLFERISLVEKVFHH